jgi:hypothetical protein
MSRPAPAADVARLHATVERHLGADLPLVVRASVPAAAARWIVADPSRTRPTRHGHIRLAPNIADQLGRVARALSWMEDSSRHHGQGAAEAARKALRGVTARRLDFPGLVTACRTFQKQRQAAIRANALSKRRTEPLRVALPRTGATACRIASEADLAVLGREARNCLAHLDPDDRYRRWLRSGAIEVWRLADASDALLAVVVVDPNCDTLDEALGPRNEDLAPDARAAVVEFMAKRGLTTEALQDVAICDEIVVATAAGILERREAFIAGLPCTLEIAPGAVAARTHVAEGYWMLRARDRERGRLWTCSGGIYALDEAEANPSAVREAVMRCGLRSACRDNRELARTLLAAFSAAPAWFRDDWLGFGVGCPGVIPGTSR